MTDPLSGVTWIKQASIRIRREGRTLYVDPWGVPDDDASDFILLTHPHYDHFSEEDIDRVRREETVVVAPQTMRKQLGDADHFVRPGDMLQLDGLDVLGVPAYNVEKKFHPLESGWLGYVFTFGGVTYYHAGDTDYHDSMPGIRCDVAFLPCDGQYTMDAEAAARAGRACGASIVVPVHWGDVAGSEDDARRVAELFDGEVRILRRGEEVA